MRSALQPSWPPSPESGMKLKTFSDRYLKNRTLRTWTATVLAILGLAVLNAHPVMTAPRLAASMQEAAELAQYRLPDGSLPYICVIDAGESSQRGGTPRHCPLCTLCELPPLPFHKFQAAFFLLERNGTSIHSAQIPVHGHASGGLGPRAPPAIV